MNFFLTNVYNAGKPIEPPKNQEQIDLMQRRFKENEFNIMASDAISVNRSLPDVRSESFV